MLDATENAAMRAGVAGAGPCRPASCAEWHLPVAMVLLIAVLDLAASRFMPLAFSGWALPLGAVCGLLLLSLVYRTVRPLPPLAELALYAALWVAFSAAAGIFTYFAAALRLPLHDAAFAAVDRGLGFDWLAWVHAVRAHPAANLALRLAYASLPAQVVGSLAWFAFARIPGRNPELLAGAALALIPTALISGLLPSLGPFMQYGTGAFAPHDAAYVADVLALRGDGPPTFALGRMLGIITFPSYHASLAVLFAHAHRGVRRSGPAVAGLNLAMLLSIASEGGHYLVDILAGAAVGGAAILAVQGLQARRGSAPDPAGA